MFPYGLHLVLQLPMRSNVDVALLRRCRSRWLCDEHLVEVIIHNVVVVMACVHAPVQSLHSSGQYISTTQDSNFLTLPVA